LDCHLPAKYEIAGKTQVAKNGSQVVESGWRSRSVPPRLAWLLRARPCGRFAPPATRRRVPPCTPESPPRRLPAAFFFAGRPDGRRVRNCPCKASPGSCRRGIGCSVRYSVPGVVEGRVSFARLTVRSGMTLRICERSLMSAACAPRLKSSKLSTRRSCAEARASDSANQLRQRPTTGGIARISCEQLRELVLTSALRRSSAVS
jgi:hypothetical protein